MNTLTQYEPVIGLEVHAQLKTATKLFCNCPNQFGREPNSNICPVCTGLPGSLPVINQEAVELATRAAFALDCQIQAHSKFDRKQYFYPDLPKGYQISQFQEPIALGGKLTLPDGSTVRLTRIHMEEDAGKLIHAGSERLHGSTYSLVDLNRAGTPLVEIVSEPDIFSAEQARLYVQELRLILMYCGICDGNLEEGSFRCDINVSLRAKGTSKLGTRAEIKNVNSFRSILRAIEHEMERQAEILDAGGKIIQETRLWEENSGKTVSMRSKEEANDYRYFPDPDLHPLMLEESYLERVKASLPLLPSEKRVLYKQQYALNEEEIFIFIEDQERGVFFDETVKLSANAKKISSLLNSAISAMAKANGNETLQESKLTAERLAELVNAIDAGKISDSAARSELIPVMIGKEGKLEDLIQELGLAQLNDEGEIVAGVQSILSEFPDQLAELRSGKDKMRAFFVGQIMKRFKGKASPALVNKLLDAELVS